jgi:thiol-disulfide isomerase/thioredoxin
MFFTFVDKERFEDSWLVKERPEMAGVVAIRQHTIDSRYLQASNLACLAFGILLLVLARRVRTSPVAVTRACFAIFAGVVLFLAALNLHTLANPIVLSFKIAVVIALAWAHAAALAYAGKAPYKGRIAATTAVLVVALLGAGVYVNAPALLTKVCVRFRTESMEPHWAFARAGDLIARRFADSPDIANFCEVLAFGSDPPPWAGRYEGHLRSILDQNANRYVRGAAHMALARVVQQSGEARQDEAAGIYRQFLKDFDPKDTPPCLSGLEPMQRHWAEAELEEIRARGLGHAAPELDGEDLDGKPMRLADFKGKVVLLSFWATWCGPCMRLVPHEREVATRLQGRPFAIVGVNGDREKERALAACEKERMTWRSFVNERAGRPGIDKAWGVEGWPTLYLIDHKGVIRKRWRGSPVLEELDTTIDRLVEKAEQEGLGRNPCSGER